MALYQISVLKQQLKVEDVTSSAVEKFQPVEVPLLNKKIASNTVTKKK